MLRLVLFHRKGGSDRKQSVRDPSYWNHFWLWFMPIFGLFAAQGVVLACRMITWPDESGYLHLGYLAATGRISLSQDEIVATRMPLPFYVLGFSQVLAGRDLLAARLVCLGFALAALVLVALIARHVAGDVAGLLAAMFFASEGALVGYLSTATYHSLAALILLAGMALVLRGRSPWGDILGMGVLSLLFLVRTNLWAILPGAFIFLLVRVRGAGARSLLVGAAVIVPVTFFLSDIRHLKLLAYVPVLRRLVEPLGYHSTLSLTAFEPFPLARWPIAVFRLVRIYEFWFMAGTALAVLGVAHALRVRPAWRQFRESPTLVIAGFFLYVSASQVVVFWDRLRQYVAYFPSWAPLGAILLGIGFAIVLRQEGLSRWTWWGAVAVLALTFVAPVVWVRNPLLPVGRDARVLAIHQLAKAVTHFRRLIPAQARVFLWGNSMPLYLAGRDPYLQQIYSYETLAAVEDRGLIPTHGLWGLAEMDAWLSADADYAVIQSSLLHDYRSTRAVQIEHLKMLLAKYFVRIDRVEDYTWFVFDVYARRRPGP